jgi:hypothetical protein
MSVALANSADVQLELIQQRCDTPSMYLDFLDAGHEGMQHWSSWPYDYDEKLQRALSNGYSIGQQGDSPRGRFVYLWNEGHPGTIIEMAHNTPDLRYNMALGGKVMVRWQRHNYRGRRTKSPQNLIIALFELK